MKTCLYIDGFNLFHGALRKTSYRWLDLQALVKNILPEIAVINKIKYFTARISDTPDDPTLATRQDIYLRAIRTFTPNVEIYFGFFQKKKVEMNLVTPTKDCLIAKVWRYEEKGTDVNLAVHMLNDAWLNIFDYAAVISNDSDLVEAFKLVKALQKKIILITPSVNHGRGTSKKLTSFADHVRHIDKSVLARSQLPNPIPGTKIHKPIIW